tara:strand:- start:4 stop:183 length:180 start_codon:yes stop_codon:yes gene_type:complete
VSKAENKITNSYTFFECISCKFSKKRKFMDGDTVFLTNQKCTECDGKMLVTKIFGEIMD